MHPDRKPSLAGEVGSTLSGWIVGQIKIIGVLAIIYTVGFAIAGVPWWFLIGPVCAALNIVPFLGPTIALALSAGVAYLGTYDLYAPIGALITFVLAQALEGFYLTPKILGRRLQLSPIAVFLAILVGGLMFGPLGVIFAAPILAILAVFWRRSRAA